MEFDCVGSWSLPFYLLWHFFHCPDLCRTLLLLEPWLLEVHIALAEVSLLLSWLTCWKLEQEPVDMILLCLKQLPADTPQPTRCILYLSHQSGESYSFHRLFLYAVFIGWFHKSHKSIVKGNKSIRPFNRYILVWTLSYFRFSYHICSYNKRHLRTVSRIWNHKSQCVYRCCLKRYFYCSFYATQVIKVTSIWSLNNKIKDQMTKF